MATENPVSFKQNSPYQKIRPLPWWFVGLLVAVSAVLAYLPDEWPVVDGLGKVFFSLGGAAAIHTSFYRWNLFPIGKSGLIVSCSSCFLPFIQIPLAWLVSWQVLICIVAICWVCICVFGMLGAVRADRLFTTLAQQLVETEYPFDFFISISRRFSSVEAVKQFENLVMPTMKEHGDMLECWYASNSHEDADYWMGRMDLLFTISDIHLLLDIDSSPATRHEVKLSKKKVLRPNPTYLRLIFPNEHDIHKALSWPFCVHISDRGPACRINYVMHCANIRLRSDLDREEFPQRFERIVNIIKAIRLLSAGHIREGRSLFNSSWQSPDFDSLIAFLSARSQLAVLLLPDNHQTLQAVLAKLDPFKRKQIARINFVTKFVLDAENSEKIPSLHQIFMSLRDILYEGIMIETALSKNLQIFAKGFIGLLAVFSSLNAWIYLQLIRTRKRHTKETSANTP